MTIKKNEWPSYVPLPAKGAFHDLEKTKALSDKELSDIADRIIEKYAPQKPPLTKQEAATLIKLLKRTLPIFSNTQANEFSFNDSIDDGDILETILDEFISWIKKAN